MIDINKAIIARIKVGKENFEILVDCENAIKLKQGAKVEMDSVLATRDIYKDVKKGLHASENELKELFGTNDKIKIATEIIKNGEMQLTTEYRNKLRDEKKNRIVDILHKNTINPQTNLPHPVQRIENAMNESKVKIDEFKKPEEQVFDVLAGIKSIIPIKLERRQLSIKIPAEYATKCYHLLKEYGELIKDNWQNDGSLAVVLEIPAGIQEAFESRLNSVTRGSIELKVVRVI